MSETDSHRLFLKLQSVTRFEVLRCIAHGSPDDEVMAMIQTAWDEGEEANKTCLSDYTVNLNTEVKAYRIDPLIGRKNEMERLAILMPPPQNNPLLVGEAGVGKPRWRKVWHIKSSTAAFQTRLKMPKPRWIWARCWRARNTVATLKRGQIRLENSSENSARHFVYRRNPQAIRN